MGQRLELLKQIAHGLAVQFGSSCEIVIHDLQKKELESSIVYIENGHISNRKLGDGPSSVVLETLSRDPSQIQDRLSYLTKTDDGRILKSSTMYIRDEDDLIVYIFSLNYDITALLTIDTALQSLISVEKESGSDDERDQPQKITHNVNDLLDVLIEQALALVGKPVALMSKDDKITVVQYLNNAGAFLITKSGDKIASLLGISKFTLYSYMDAGK
ncbi:helix-turn-helix transcriptional regulator [Faecalicatena sp. AGMB00832]|uniref:Helix-turn-helix transcriptional regulator n=1 Tax=Faecalicatena faecalis TaxID=2726362 RepID=A0ABS6D7W2_9FIRM|nr:MULTISPECIES: helix-turn-helix transcriptional regulator [Faecalicatena]MBU3877683.1 helix-turn-helix transcriptional regulator [Faecalicatena faecalis]MCI6466216.1 helix-turn-helix transcriptional regulator [Faecalicatena sp.]MDY5619382.1 helix-turn-helix transcriptional regulator [Lachnospiraceae bacterium]